MARRPTLSPSKLTCYLACPHKYYWTYESAKGQWYLRARSYYAFGQSLHRALESFHRSGDAGVPATDSLLAAFEESWIDSGYSSPDEMQEAFGEGKSILERYAEEQLASAAVAKVLFVEKSLRLKMGEWDLIGRADRIDEREDGSIEIVDYKSGRSSVSSEDVANDVAMSAYALMTSGLFPGLSVHATILALRSEARATHTFSAEELSEFEFSVRELGEEIRNRHWEEFHPVPKALCRTCDFLPLCRKVPEYAAEALDILNAS